MRLKASYVVENAVIIPVFVMIVVNLIIVSFYMHDVMIIKNTLLKIGVMSEFDCDRNNSEEYELMGNDYIQAKTIYTRSPQIDITDTVTQYKVTAQGEFSSRLAVLNQFNKITKEVTIYKNNPDNFIRMTNAAKEVANQIKDHNVKKE